MKLPRSCSCILAGMLLVACSVQPNLFVQDDAQYGMGALSNCVLPCLARITPGRSTWSVVKSEYSHSVDWPITPYRENDWRIGEVMYSARVSQSEYHHIRVLSDTIVEVQIDGLKAADLKQLLNLNSTVAGMYLRTYNAPKEGAIPFEFVLFTGDGKAYLDLFVSAESSGDRIVGCIDPRRVTGVVTSWSESESAHALARFWESKSEKYNPLRMIDQVVSGGSGVVSSALSRQARFCLTTESSLWPSP